LHRRDEPDLHAEALHLAANGLLHLDRALAHEVVLHRAEALLVHEAQLRHGVVAGVRGKHPEVGRELQRERRRRSARATLPRQRSKRCRRQCGTGRGGQRRPYECSPLHGATSPL